MTDPVFPPPVDAVTSGAPPPTPLPAPRDIMRLKRMMIMLVAIIYGGYILLSLLMMMLLPFPTGEGKSVVSVGLLLSLSGAVALLLAGWFVVMRISASQTSIATRRRSLLIVIAALIPGFLVSAATPLLITREPALPLDIIEPQNTADLVAPVAVTFSVARAQDILAKRGFRSVKVQWDTDNDGTMNDETVLPTTTAVYERQGVYTASARIILDGGDSRVLKRRITIPQAVFSVLPVQPIMEKPLKFSIAHLLTDVKQLKQVEWDFGDGSSPETITKPDAIHTYYAAGSYPVTVTVQLLNNNQATYKRTVNVREPPELPFPITLVTEPKSLIGPAPFGAIFRLETEEPIKEVLWSFGDGKKEDRGAAVLRQSHTFDRPGIYPVSVRARSGSGKLAELNVLVRVTEKLPLPDLTFEGEPDVKNARIEGEVPLEISLTPKTSAPLVQFSWEMDDEWELQADGPALKGIFRTEGTYTITLVAQGAEEKSMRLPITVEVRPPSAEPSIQMKPDGGMAPLTVTFDASRTFIPPGETVAGFKWLFGDELQARQPELGGAQVQHVYKTAGEFTVTLAVVLTSGDEYIAKRTLIVRNPALSACITASRVRVQAGKGVEFDSSCSAGTPASWLWDVRMDSQANVVQAQSEDPLYVHIFEEPGEYTVTLTLKDDSGNQSKKSVSITVTESDSPPSP